MLKNRVFKHLIYAYFPEFPTPKAILKYAPQDKQESEYDQGNADDGSNNGQADDYADDHQDQTQYRSHKSPGHGYNTSHQSPQCHERP
jgi:hypothetical protein